MNFPFVIIACAAALLVALAIYGAIAAARRRKELMGWAHTRGLRFNPGRVHDVDRAFAEFDCLRQGSNRYAYNVMAGKWSGRDFRGFDYHYETHSRNSKGRRQTNHHRFSAVIMASGVPLRPLFIRPEGFFDKVTEFFGLDDIDFESAEFSRKFYVKSPDKRWAYDVLHARTMEFLLSMPQFIIQFGIAHVIAYGKSRFSLGQFESAAEVVRGLLDRLPEYLVRRQTEGQ